MPNFFSWRLGQQVYVKEWDDPTEDLKGLSYPSTTI